MLQGDFTRRLVEHGVLADPGAGGVVGVVEGPILPETGGLPPEWVSGVRKELEALADPLARRRAVEQVIAAAVRRLRRGLEDVRAGLVDEANQNLIDEGTIAAPRVLYMSVRASTQSAMIGYADLWAVRPRPIERPTL